MNTKNIWQKLLEVQKAVTSFSNTEAAEKKKAGTKTSEYKYTPGWQITGEVRAQMDKLGLMMPVSIIREEHQMVEYPVYKLVNGVVTSFLKKENLSVVTMEYTWIDTETGEKAGPFQMIASGSNGIDKSTASAISAAERYIFLKFFHIATKDNDELDAHDASSIPGLKEQPETATDSQVAKHKAGMNRTVPAQETQQQMPPQAQPQPPAPQQMQFGKEYEQAVNEIAMFAIGTKSHAEAVNRAVTFLASAGYPAGDKFFVDTLVSIADNRRNGRLKSA
jgi:hypothetical protein